MFKRKKNVEFEAINKLIKDLQESEKTQKQNNYLILKENATLKHENDVVKNILKQINSLMTANKYGNDEVIKRKIIELTSDYQSNS